MYIENGTVTGILVTGLLNFKVLFLLHGHHMRES